MFTNFTFIFQYASRDKLRGYVQIISDNNKSIIIILVRKVAKYPIDVQTIKSNCCLKATLCVHYGN